MCAVLSNILTPEGASTGKKKNFFSHIKSQETNHIGYDIIGTYCSRKSI